MFNLQSATPADFTAVWSLVQACMVADYGEPLYSASRLQATWDELGPDLGTYTRLAVDPNGALVAYGVLRVYAPDDMAVVVSVPPDAPDGVEMAILAALEAQAKHAGATAVKLTSQVSERNTRLKHAYHQRSYQTNLSFLNMEIVLTAPPDLPQVPDGVVLRPFVSGRDEQAAYAADEAASQDKSYYHPLSYEAWLRRMNVQGDGFDPSLWWLAWADDEVVGVALCYYAAATGIGWIDHLGVARDWRKRGLGMALMLQSYAAFWQQGIARIRLNVESDSPTNAPSLYARAGMAVIQQYHIYHKVL